MTNPINNFIKSALVFKALNKGIKTTLLASEPLLNVGWAPKQTISISHLSTTPLKEFRLYNPELYGSFASLGHYLPINESTVQNPFGVWFGTPNQVGTIATKKPLKYARARTTFLTRPYEITGNLTLDKPLVTLGDVPNRSQLEWEAERMSADDIVFSNMYDNGMNNTVSIKALKLPTNILIHDRPRIKYYGPIMGKTTYVKLHPDGSIVDADRISTKYGNLVELRKLLASSLGLLPFEFGTSRVPKEILDTEDYLKAWDQYLTAILDQVNSWMNDPDNVGKTLVTSSKTLGNPNNKVVFSNRPSIPTFNAFLERNQARGFKETPEQALGWWNSIVEANPNIVFDNRFISEIEKNPGISYATEPESINLANIGPTNLTGDQALEAFKSRINLTKGLTLEEKDLLFHNLDHPIHTNNFDDVVELIKLKEYPGDLISPLADFWARNRMKTLYGGKIENVVEKHPGWFTDLALGLSSFDLGQPDKYRRMRVIMTDEPLKMLALKLTGKDTPENLAYYQAHYSTNNDSYQFKEALMHEVAHIRDAIFKAKGINFPELGNFGFDTEKMSNYFLSHDGTEVLARGTQIKNALGISDKTTLITGRLLYDLAVKWRSMGYKDNNMYLLFTKIKDWNQAALYFSRYALSLGLPISTVLSLATLSNEEELPIESFKKGGEPKIRIKKENRGKFTASAKAHGKGVQEYARSVVNNPNATALQKKRALFALNAKNWNH